MIELVFAVCVSAILLAFLPLILRFVFGMFFWSSEVTRSRVIEPWKQLIMAAMGPVKVVGARAPRMRPRSWGEWPWKVKRVPWSMLCTCSYTDDGVVPDPACPVCGVRVEDRG